MLDKLNYSANTFALYDQKDKLSKFTLALNKIRGVVCSSNSTGQINYGKKLDCKDTLV